MKRLKLVVAITALTTLAPLALASPADIFCPQTINVKCHSDNTGNLICSSDAPTQNAEWVNAGMNMSHAHGFNDGMNATFRFAYANADVDVPGMARCAYILGNSTQSDPNTEFDVNSKDRLYQDTSAGYYTHWAAYEDGYQCSPQGSNTQMTSYCPFLPAK
jgi:cation diffusion facilitator CzcD-associated flavoprotein CzcO